MEKEQTVDDKTTVNDDSRKDPYPLLKAAVVGFGTISLFLGIPVYLVTKGDKDADFRQLMTEQKMYGTLLTAALYSENI